MGASRTKRTKAEVADLWKSACDAAEDRIRQCGSILKLSLFDALFPDLGAGGYSRFLILFPPDGVNSEGDHACAIIPSEGAEVALRAQYRITTYNQGRTRLRGMGPEDLVTANVHIGIGWRVFMSVNESAGVTVETSRRNPETKNQDALLNSDEDWILHDPPCGGCSRVRIDFHDGEVALTRRTHFCNGEEWSPRVGDEADAGFLSDGRLAWRAWKANGVELSRGGMPRFESYWPNGKKMSVEYGNGRGEFHRNPDEGPAYQEWHPDGSCALEIYALGGRVVGGDTAHSGVRVGAPGSCLVPVDIPKIYLGFEADKVLEMRWRKTGKSHLGSRIPRKAMYRGLPTSLWRVKRFFTRHPEAAMEFPLLAAWLLSPRREFHHQAAIRQPRRRPSPKGGAMAGEEK
jgi:hypothetical protein